MTLRLATRKSPLARWQAEQTRTLLQGVLPGVEVELVLVSSSGDRDRTTELARFGRIGIFTVEVDRALLEGRADIGVHSLKDMTTTLQEGIELGGVLQRGPVEDAWVHREGTSLENAPPGTRVATDSLRRRAMLLALRPDFVVQSMRGNVETRLDKLDRKEADALILARAGLVRLGFQRRITEVLDLERFLPAAGQGTIGLTLRREDETNRRRLQSLSDLEAYHESLAERAVLKELRGGCNVPVGIHARAVESTVHIRARVLAADGSEEVAGEITGPRDQAVSLGKVLARDLGERGADTWIQAARA